MVNNHNHQFMAKLACNPIAAASQLMNELDQLTPVEGLIRVAVVVPMGFTLLLINLGLAFLATKTCQQ